MQDVLWLGFFSWFCWEDKTLFYQYSTANDEVFMRDVCLLFHDYFGCFGCNSDFCN